MEAMAYEDMAWDGGYGLECLGMKMKQTNWR